MPLYFLYGSKNKRRRNTRKYVLSFEQFLNKNCRQLLKKFKPCMPCISCMVQKKIWTRTKNARVFFA